MNDQRSLAQQLNDLVSLANTAGLYDAADFVQGILDRSEDLKKKRDDACSMCRGSEGHHKMSCVRAKLARRDVIK